MSEENNDITQYNDKNQMRQMNVKNKINDAYNNCNQIVVKLNDVHYSYAKEKVLNGVTMTITKGTIYGLLGASGCGKTTTLRTLIGIINPSQGNVSVFGEIPGSSTSLIPGNGVGYMPQDIALFSLFSINESMVYYAKLTQMKSKTVNDRIKHLSTLLKLPDGDTQISTLSGGQKRRVSLVIALLHEPPLLILDEPTVGVDSLLRETIWTHLKEICAKNGQTIIITTHYIEEAKASHCIGLMRKGILLIEDNPQMIMHKVNESSLEKAFLKLSYDQEYDPNKMKFNIKDDAYKYGETSNSFVNYNANTDECSIIIKSNHSNQMSALMSGLLLKNIILFKKNFIFLLFYMTALPAMIVMFYATVTGVNPKYIPMGVINEDSPPLSSKFIIDNIDPTVITLREFTTLSEAIQSVKDYRTYGIIRFPKNYTQSMQIALFDCDYGKSNDKTQDSEIIVTTETYKLNETESSNDYDSDEGNDTINADLKKNNKLFTQIDLIMDMTDQIFVRTIEKELYDTFKRVADKTKNLTESLTEIPIESPVKVIDPPIYGKNVTFIRDFFVHAMVFVTIFPFSLSITGLLILIERNDRIIERSYSCGLKIHHIILSHFITQVMVSVVQVISSLLCVHLYFGYTCEGSIILAFLLFLIQSIIGISLSLFVSSLCDDENNAIIILVGLLLPMISLAGAFWPRQAYVKHFQYILMSLPMALNFDAIRAIYQKGWGLSSITVQLGFGVSLLWVIGLTLLAFYFYNKRIY